MMTYRLTAEYLRKRLKSSISSKHAKK